VAGAPPRNPLREFTALPRPLLGGEGVTAPPQELHPALNLSGLGSLGLACPVP